LQSDPLGIEADQPYAYAANNPLVYRDPSGLEAVANVAGRPWSLASSLDWLDSWSYSPGVQGGLARGSSASLLSGALRIGYDDEARGLVAPTRSGESVGAPGFAESLIPIWGSGRTAINDLQEGNYGWAAFNAAVAVSDVFLVGVAAKGVAKGAFKLGSHTWNATRKWYGQTRGLESGTPVHHWLVERGGAVGRHVPDAIKNQPWNLMPMRSQAFHNQVHGWGPDALNSAGRLWYGTPGWAKAGAFSATSRGVETLWGP
jgi:hypothetical protein